MFHGSSEYTHDFCFLIRGNFDTGGSYPGSSRIFGPLAVTKNIPETAHRTSENRKGPSEEGSTAPVAERGAGHGAGVGLWEDEEMNGQAGALEAVT